MENKQFCYHYPHPAVTTDCVIFGFDGSNCYDTEEPSSTRTN